MSKVDPLFLPAFNGNGPGYDADFSAWSEEQSRRLRSLRIPGLDVENIAEEIEGLSRSDKREIADRLQVLLMHLLKWHVQPVARCANWRGTIREQRRQIISLLDESPSLKPRAPEWLIKRYPDAVDAASNETGMTEKAFAAECPWTVAQVLAADFFPGDLDR